MICLLFNLSYNAMMCEWRQLVYIAMITPNKLTIPPFFATYNRSFGNKAQNANFSTKEQHQKLGLPIINF